MRCLKMNVLKACLLFFILITFFGQIYGDIDSKEFFCGKKLVQTLTELCVIYNSPSFGRSRFRRQIVEECCKTQCSRRHLVQYYCSEANSSVINLLKAKPEETTSLETDTRDYQSDDARIVSDEHQPVTVGTLADDANIKNALYPGSHQFDSSSTSYHNKISGRKRHCKCRKRRAKRVKKFQPFRSNRNFQNPVPPPNIGQIEGSQEPFYVWKYPRMI